MNVITEFVRGVLLRQKQQISLVRIIDKKVVSGFQVASIFEKNVMMQHHSYYDIPSYLVYFKYEEQTYYINDYSIYDALSIGQKVKATIWTNQQKTTAIFICGKKAFFS